MKRRIIKFDQFLVWVFNMNKGEIKTFRADEITRNLTTFGEMTMNPISVFVSGSFVTHRDGMPPLYSNPGDGGARWIEAESLSGLALEALEDGSEYHCILPRDDTARFWNRYVYKCERVGQCIGLTTGDYVYVARGSVHINKTTVQQYQLARLVKPTDVVSTTEDAIVVTLHEPKI